jgi:hypothetical protein
MSGLIVTILIGILVCVLGAVNMTGNISSLHSYHRKRVREEDKKPFGRLVGIGSIIIGVSIIVLGVSMYLYERTQVPAYSIFGAVFVCIGLICGLALSFFAMIKYNKGIF